MNENESNEVVSPFNFKKIGIFIVNVIIFFFYFYLINFVFGFIIGMMEGFGILDAGTVENASDGFWATISLVTFIVVIAMTVLFRKKLYLRVVKKPDPEASE